MMRRFFLVIVTAVLLTACRKDGEHPVGECLEGTIAWAGDPAADGLGWTLQVNPENPQYYVLKNLPPIYRKDGLAVAACLYPTGEKASCFCQPAPDLYGVASIRKR